MTNIDPVTNSNLIEQLTAIEHERWADWMRYFFSKCVVEPDGSLNIPVSYFNNLQRLIDTTYADLSEAEKQSDRREVERYLHLLQ